jgi:predicted CopG family antitoxin
MYKRITVGLRQDVYTRLRNKGRFGETFSDLVSRLIDEVDTTIADKGGSKFSDD